MSDQDAFARILASLCDATLDETRWPVTSALIDEACGITGNCLLIGEGPPDDIRAMFVGVYARGERQADLEREYLQVYHPIDEAVPRLRKLPDSQLVPIPDMYTAEELKSSPSYNDLLRRAHYQQGLNVRLDGPDRSHITWGLGDPVASEGWGSAKIALLQRLLPQIRQFVCVRQALVRAGARATTAGALLENPRIGVIHLDRRGQILEINDRARSLLRRGQGLSDRDGVLRTRQSADQRCLERLVAGALPTAGAVPVSGSMLASAAGAPPFVVHVKPVAVPQPDYGARYVAALVLLIEPRSQHRIDPDLVTRTLGLTPMESRIAVGLAEGKSVRELAAATGRTPGAISWHLKQIYRKQPISGQVDLVRLVLSLTEFE